MGKRAGSPPPAPDPRATAEAQAQMNQETARTNARLNRVNQRTPWGDLIFNDLGDDRWEARTQLSPTMARAQELYSDMALGQLGRLRERLSTPFSLAEAGIARDRVEEALMDRLRPQLERERSALETRLATQGITPGAEAWRTQFDDYNRGANDARLGVIRDAGQEQSRMAQLLAMERSLPLQETLALLTGQQAGSPQWAPVAQVGMQAPDYQGAVAQNYAGNMNAWNTQAQMAGQTNASIMSLLGNIAGAAAFRFSDRRLKHDVVQVGTGVHDLPIYEWTYAWGERGVGFMADEVEAIRPDCVIRHADGYALVNYGGLLA